MLYVQTNVVGDALFYHQKNLAISNGGSLTKFRVIFQGDLLKQGDFAAHLRSVAYLSNYCANSK